jgi:hypothetical protein
MTQSPKQAEMLMQSKLEEARKAAADAFNQAVTLAIIRPDVEDILDAAREAVTTLDKGIEALEEITRSKADLWNDGFAAWVYLFAKPEDNDIRAEGWQAAADYNEGGGGERPTKNHAAELNPYK